MAAPAVGWYLVMVATGVVVLAFAATVLLAAPARSLNRLLALVFLLLGTNYVADGLSEVVTSDWLSFNFFLYNSVTWQLLPFAYLLFLGVALETPLTRPLRTLPARATLALCALVVAGSLYAEAMLVTDVARGPDGTWGDLNSIGPAFATDWFVTYIPIGAFVYGLIASLDALRRAPPGSAMRRRARAYAFAFGVQDVTIVVGNLLLNVGAPFDSITFNLFWSLPMLAALGLLARALLREQLFDFDLKLKVGVRRGAVVGVFLAAFFVAASIAEQYVQQEFGLLAGGVVVGLLLFAMRPIERAADRVANVAMPRVQDTDEYRTVRKREVYRAAVESAMEDGAITDKERGVLATLAAQLGLDPREAYELEREARRAAAQ